jgi:hypothetical protein
MKNMDGIALLGAAALLLVACGGGGGDDRAPTPVATTDVPASAQADPAGLLAFINQQIGSSSDSSEPILLGEAVLPVDDTTETSL